MITLVGILAGSLFIWSPATASNNSADAFTKATDALLHWVRSLSIRMAKQQHDEFVTGLRTLDTEVRELERTTSEFLSSTQDPAGDLQDLKNTAAAIRSQIGLLTKAIDSIALMLPDKQETRGVDCEQFLTDAIAERRTWVVEAIADPGMLKADGKKAAIVERGEYTIANLQKASLRLTALLERLERGELKRGASTHPSR